MAVPVRMPRCRAVDTRTFCSLARASRQVTWTERGSDVGEDFVVVGESA